MSEPKSRAPAKRKTSPRGTTGTKKPALSALFREKWKDPEYREKMRLVNVRREEDRKINPEKYNRTRVPDGMRKRQAMKLWSKAETLAENFILMMKDEGLLPAVVDPGTDEARAELALKEAVVLAIGPGDNKIKTANIRTVLEWTRAKPESKSKLTVAKSEDWLEAAQADMDNGD